LRRGSPVALEHVYLMLVYYAVGGCHEEFSIGVYELLDGEAFPAIQLAAYELQTAVEGMGGGAGVFEIGHFLMC
jgi:hypothetical protein